MHAIKSPFPYFGGKSSIASRVWDAMGNVENYVEPFFGSGAVLLSRPTAPHTETVNDLDCLLANFWRAVSADPDAVADYADWPVNENDLHARHSWLVGQKDDVRAHMEGDPDWYDAKIAGWWVWGIACWIGGGWCSGKGPWHVIDGQLVHLGDDGQGVNRKLVHLGDDGQGVNRQLVHLGDDGQGVNRKLVHLGNDGRRVKRKRDELRAYLGEIADRTRNVRVCCGDFERVLGPTPTVRMGLTGVFLDPPYSNDIRADGLYTHDDGSVAGRARKWALDHGGNPKLRIVLCGYADEHEMQDWRQILWSAKGGYDGQGDGTNANRHKECLWLSPHCLGNDLFGG